MPHYSDAAINAITSRTQSASSIALAEDVREARGEIERLRGMLREIVRDLNGAGVNYGEDVPTPEGVRAVIRERDDARAALRSGVDKRAGLKPGDVVRLRGELRPMTVLRVPHGPGATYVGVVWLDNNGRGQFSEGPPEMFVKCDAVGGQ